MERAIKDATVMPIFIQSKIMSKKGVMDRMISGLPMKRFEAIRADDWTGAVLN